MVKHLFKLIWNKKKQNFLLLTEILISFIVIFAVFSFGVFSYKNYMKPMGIDYEDVWVINYNNPANSTNADSVTLFYETLKRNVKALPNVIEAGYCSNNFPFSGNMMSSGLSYQGKAISNVNQFNADLDYIKILNAKMLEGRWYTKDDYLPGERKMVINKSLKEVSFGKGQAIGKYLHNYGGKEKIKVIGVIDDIKFNGDFLPTAKGMYYLLDTAAYKWTGNMMVKVKPGSDAAFEGKLYKTMINSLKNSNIEIKHLTDKIVNVNKITLVPLIIASIIAAFLIINVALGLFGVLWYNISKRRGEIGLRRAVGASGNSVSGQLVAESLILATFSLLIGSFFAVQFPLLNVFDLPAMVYIIALLLAMLFIYLLVLICALYPGRQAANIYPAVALHEE
ncbi:FtsX-like permease family protein [Mucilaginibacter gynuensis]|uniref:FtsX-like permease family protein n=1 Tax=Mucilaginibacter gynuensis TaxID=1302236 RepID=A0ABP8GA39_9SPHI